jgi:hypothetical protein
MLPWFRQVKEPGSLQPLAKLDIWGLNRQRKLLAGNSLQRR